MGVMEVLAAVSGPKAPKKVVSAGAPAR
jgi:hypothetical protein